MLTDPFGTNAITRRIIGCAIRVHDFVGPGLFESIYQECMQYELKEDGLSFEVQVEAPVVYKGHRLNSKFYLDLRIEGVVPVELKSVETLHPVHGKQLLSQLWLTNHPVGLLINFNVPVLKLGIKRFVL